MDAEVSCSIRYTFNSGLIFLFVGAKMVGFGRNIFILYLIASFLICQSGFFKTVPSYLDIYNFILQNYRFIQWKIFINILKCKDKS